MSQQDWETVVIRNPRAKVVEPRKTSTEAQRLYKLAETTDATPLKKRLTKESRQDLAAARNAMKKTQKEIDTALAFPANTIRDFESGARVPTGVQISALHRYFAAAKLVLRTEEY
jgi:hypothetical protein